VDGLYIKLDKKLTLKADKIIIPKRKANPSFSRIDETLENVKYLLTFFEHIDIKEIDFDNNIMGIYFRDNIIQLSSEDYLIRGNIRREGKILKGTVPILQLKKHHITLRGTFSYDLHEDILNTEGKFLFQTVSGEFNASKVKDDISFSLKSDTFSELKPLLKPFDLNKNLASWIAEKVIAKQYKVKSLSAQGMVENENFKMDVRTLKAEVLLLDVLIHFKENLAPVVVLKATLTYEDKKGLYFDLSKPSYLDKSLEGSRISIVHLRDLNTTLNLDLNLNVSFDETVKKLLEKYDVDIPVHQVSGKSLAKLKIDIGLKKEYFKLHADVNLSEGDLLINEIKVPIVKGSLAYEDGQVDLKDIIVKNSDYAGMLNAKIDLEKKKVKGTFDTKYIKIGKNKKPFIHLKSVILPFFVHYKNNISVDVPKLAFLLKHDKKKTQLILNDLSKVKQYVSNDLSIEDGGTVEIVTKDFKDYAFSGRLKRHTCFFYEKENVCHTNIPFEGKVHNNKFEFNAFNKRLQYSENKSRLNIRNINIDLENFLERSKKTKKTKYNPKSKRELIIVGKKSNLRYGKYRLITDSYDVEVYTNGDIKALGSSAGDIIKFSKKKDIVSIQALRIKDSVLHPLLNFDGLKNGRYSIKNKGNPEKVMKGQIIIEGGVMKDFSAYDNASKFVNTLPELNTIHTKNYKSRGFQIEEGIIEYRMIKQDKVIFDSIYIRGKEATIVGKGELDLKKKTIDIDMSIQVAREIGKVVGSIPLVGYILMGKDKSINVGLKITGSLKKPIVKTSAVKDILSTPLELIKRTLESPKHIINQ
jgi:hypothetical protein